MPPKKSNLNNARSREARRKRLARTRQSAELAAIVNNMKKEWNGEEIISAVSQSPSGSEASQASGIRRNEQAKESKAQKKRERQQRYREQNREKLKKREAERRRRLQNAEISTELSTSRNIESTEILNEPTIDEDGLEGMQRLFVEVSQRNQKAQMEQDFIPA